MLSSQLLPPHSRFIKLVRQNLRQCLTLAGLLIALVCSTGCSSLTLPLSISTQPAQLELAIEQVIPSGRPGAYSLSGRTNLPDQTPITISAVRYLQTELKQSPPDESTYAILARQTVNVNQGKWQTSLNLWQTAPDGKFREAWQLDQANLESQVSPASAVTFLATLDPVNNPATLQAQLERQNKRFEGNLVHFNSDGESYLQASKTVSAALPTGGTTPRALTAEEINGGWGDRSRLTQNTAAVSKVNLPAATTSQTTAPLAPDEFMH